MSLWLDVKFASIAGARLDQFKIVRHKPFNAMYRCPFCGDSQRNKFKKRGYFYEKGGHVVAKCHNCGYGPKLISNFLNQFDQTLYGDYRMESLREGKMPDEVVPEFTPQIEKFSRRRIDNFEPMQELRKISQLPVFHPAKRYISKRKIPSDQHYRIYYTDTYMSWVNTFLPDKFDEKALAHDEPRIVFPFIDANGYVFGFTGRSLAPTSERRYIAIVTDDSKPKIYGLETIDRFKTVYVVEGPIDSLFLHNCCAMGGSSVPFNLIAEQENLVVIYDNEPRNKQICDKIQQTIKDGYNVCIWPDNIEQKDINEMVLAGMSSALVQATIDQNTFQGLRAQLRFNAWKKV